MHFGLSEEQDMIVNTVRAFVENEIYPHEGSKPDLLDWRLVMKGNLIEIVLDPMFLGTYHSNLSCLKSRMMAWWK